MFVSHIPYPRSLVSRARYDQATILGKVERVDLLLVTVEHCVDASRCNVPNLCAIDVRTALATAGHVKETYADLLVFCTRREVLAVWTEAHAANVQVASLTCFLIHQYT